MYLFIAILWSIGFVVNAISCAMGNSPSLISFFCVYTIVVLYGWDNYFKRK